MTSPAPLAGVNMMVSALWWARKGVPVLPLYYPLDDGTCSCHDAECTSIGKHPIRTLVPRGLTQASTDPDTVRDWWAQEPYANIGIRTGEMVDLLDIDSTEGMAAFGEIVQRCGGQPHHLGVARSGRDGIGMHFYVAPGGQRALSGGKTAPAGIDVKGRGGYAVAPPSMHASGRRYEWVTNGFDDGVVLGDISWEQFYSELVVRPQRAPMAPRPTTEIPAEAADAYGRAVLARAVDLVRSCSPGHRWQTLATEAIPLAARGVDGGCIDRDSAVRELEEAARAIGLDGREIGRIGPLVDDMVARGITHPIRPREAAGIAAAAAPAPAYETEDEARADPWEPPWPLQYPTQPFPLDTMGWMAGPVRDLANQLQCPIDLVATMTIAAVAATIRGRIRARFVGDWEEPLNLYIAAVLGPGETKSPALSRIVAPLREMETEARAETKDLIVRARYEKELADSKAKKLRDEFMKSNETNDYNRQQMIEAARDAAIEADEITVPPVPLYLAGDMTPEALVAKLAEQGGALAHLSAEGELLDTIVGGRYSSGAPHLTALLTAHDGREPVRVHRKRDEDIEVPNPCLTLGLAVQPHVLEQMGGVDAAVRRGLAARFLYSMPASLVGRRDMTMRHSTDTAKAFEVLLRGIDELCQASGGTGDIGPSIREVESGARGVRGGSDAGGFGDNGPSFYKYGFTDSSSSLVIHYREGLEPRRAAQTGDLGEIGPWANKLDGQIIRLATVLQILRDVDPASSTPGTRAQNPRNPEGVVDVEATSAALVLAEYLISHAIEAHAVMSGGSDPDKKPAAQLLGWIRANGAEEFTVHEAERSLRKRVTFREQGSVHQACATLARLGYVRLVPREEGKPGRPSVRYLVHPEVLR